MNPKTRSMAAFGSFPHWGKAGIGATLLLLFNTSCTKELEYELNDVQLNPPGTIKDNEKTNQQYAAILHANLFQDAMSANELYELDQCIQSIGDKELAREVIISNFMNKPGVIIPDDATMRADVAAFIIGTYNR